MLDFMSFQFPLIQRFTAAPRLCVVRDGKLVRRNMGREFITDKELNAKIRQEAVETSPASNICFSKLTVN